MFQRTRMASLEARDDTQLATHFEFGANWRKFLELIDESRVEASESSLRSFLQLVDVAKPLERKRFLDAGCGSGLFSLAAQRLGADVVSFDLDPQSVACANVLRQRFADSSECWSIQEGSALDREFLAGLGDFDVVYSWGVLHHTGAMWAAIDAVSARTAAGGQFFLAIYNDQGDLSDIWRGIKKLYGRLPHWLRTFYVAIVGACYYGARVLMTISRVVGRTILGVRSSQEEPESSESKSSRAAKHYGARGMSRWYDLVDWVGGYPFEVATVDAIIAFLAERNFQLEKVKSVGGKLGCNELVFRKRC